MADIQLKLEGLTCCGCVKAVREALAQVDGIDSAEVTQDSVQIKGNVSAEVVIAAIEQAGFEAFAE